MLHWLKLKYIGRYIVWDRNILSETKILCLRPRSFVWDRNTLSETKIHCLRLTNYYCLWNSIAYIVSSLTLYFPQQSISSLLCIFLTYLPFCFVTHTLLPLLPKSLSLSTAYLSSASIYYIHFKLILLILVSQVALFYRCKRSKIR